MLPVTGKTFDVSVFAGVRGTARPPGGESRGAAAPLAAGGIPLSEIIKTNKHNILSINGLTENPRQAKKYYSIMPISCETDRKEEN